MINLSPEQINSAFANLSDEIVFASNIVDPSLKIKEISVQNNLGKETSASLDFLLTLKIVNLINEKTLLEEIYSLPIEGVDLKNKIFEQIKAIYKSIESLVELKKERVLLLQHKDTEQAEDERFSNLPARVKDSIAFSGWEESLFEITKNHKLNIDQSGIFEDLTIKAIKNEISSEEYRDQILTKISVDKEKALEIISSVNEKIFKIGRAHV